MGVIYQIVIAGDDRSYIGSTTYFPRRRSHHRWCLKNRTHHCVALRHAVVKHGLETVEFKILEKLDDASRLLEREQYWLDMFRGRLFNKSTTATPGASRQLTAEQKEAVSKFHMGRKRSPETKARMSASMKGNTNGRHTKKPFCGKGHQMSGDNLYFYKIASGKIRSACRICMWANSRVQQQRRRKQKKETVCLTSS